eukprot:scaffold15928_cov86-Isochrysis_galbana.AAC.3
MEAPRRAEVLRAPCVRTAGWTSALTGGDTRAEPGVVSGGVVLGAVEGVRGGGGRAGGRFAPAKREDPLHGGRGCRRAQRSVERGLGGGFHGAGLAREGQGARHLKGGDEGVGDGGVKAVEGR